jgi:ureidoglycolate dehydrogenase (NAD+)
MNENLILIDKDELTSLARDIFAAAGMDGERAALWARVLVWANLRGVDSHGVLRIPRYVEGLQSGGIKARPDMRVELSAGAVAMIEADRAPGPVAMSMAMEQAIRQAREAHVGWCIVRDMTHAGAVGYYALRAVDAGMAGMVMTASQPMMAYAGSRVPGVSTNPLAIAVPGEGHRPLMLDMSTATVSNGKILSARDAGEQVPEGWGLDADGRPTTDPNLLKTLLPLGGAKGSGMSVMIECLISLFVGMPLVEPVLSSGKPLAGRPLNGLAVAVDIAAFGDPASFRQRVDELAAVLVGLPRAEGVERIFAPGERGDAVLAEREASGIPLPPGTWDRLSEVADSLGVAMPPTG